MIELINKPISNMILAYKANVVPEQRFTISVANRYGKCIGMLVCVDRGLCTDMELISDLTAWRERYMGYFLTQFKATVTRTQSWLENVVIPSPDRIFFIIFLVTGEAIGNFGICNMSESSGELDNIIRGRKCGDPKLIYYCKLALLSWMFGSLGYQTSNLHVFSNNQPAIRLYSSVGFSVTKSIRLSRKTSPGLIQYLLDSDEGDSVDFSYFEMRINRETFLELYPWIQSVYADHWQ